MDSRNLCCSSALALLLFMLASAVNARFSESLLSNSQSVKEIVRSSQNSVRSSARSSDTESRREHGLTQTRFGDDDNEDDIDEDRLDDKSFLLLGSHSSRSASIGKKRGDDGAPDDSDDENFCTRRRYRKRALKTIKEIPFVGLFPELQRIRRFEASGVTYANGAYWVVFDSLRSLGKVDLRFSFRGPDNRLIGPNGTESQFEGISYSEPTDTFFVLRESMETDEHGLVPLTEELKLSDNGTDYEVLERCIVRFALQDVNKGFESLAVFYRDGKRHMLGLCESNFCKTILGPDPPGLQRGNGRLVWATYHAPEDEYDECRWDVQKVIHIPSDCYLLDYSAIAFHGSFGTDVAIVSQEDAAVWIGKFNWESMEFEQGESDGRPAGRIYHFPRTHECYKQYCNVEGVAWIDAERLVFTSDKAKQIQDFRCMEKDQSLHIMALP